MALIALDLPALERPANATSAPKSAGNCAGAAALTRKRASGKRLMSPTDRQRGCLRSVQFRALGTLEPHWKQHHAAAPENRLVGNGGLRGDADVLTRGSNENPSSGSQCTAGRGAATHIAASRRSARRD